MRCPKCNRTIYLGTYHRVQQLKVGDKVLHPISYTSYMIHDPYAPIKERIIDLEEIEFHAGYDGVFGRVVTEEEKIERKKKELKEKQVKARQMSFI